MLLAWLKDITASFRESVDFGAEPLISEIELLELKFVDRFEISNDLALEMSSKLHLASVRTGLTVEPSSSSRFFSYGFRSCCLTVARCSFLTSEISFSFLFINVIVIGETLAFL